MNESYIFAVRSFQNPEASVSFIFIFYKKKKKQINSKENGFTIPWNTSFSTDVQEN